MSNDSFDGPALTDVVNSGGSETHGLDAIGRDLNHLVEGWNHWCKHAQLSDRENYLDGHIQLFFEFVQSRRDGVAERDSVEMAAMPDYITAILAERAVIKTGGEIGHLAPDNIARKPGVVAYWDQLPMLVWDIQSVDEIEQAVSTRFSVCTKQNNCFEEPIADLMGQSVLYGFLKGFGVIGKRELDRSLLSRPNREGRDDLPISVIERTADVMNGVSSNGGCLVRNGLVLFGERGALAGLYVCLHDIGEWSLFAQEGVKLVDAFRSPLEL